MVRKIGGTDANDIPKIQTELFSLNYLLESRFEHKLTSADLDTFNAFKKEFLEENNDFDIILNEYNTNKKDNKDETIAKLEALETTILSMYIVYFKYEKEWKQQIQLSTPLENILTALTNILIILRYLKTEFGYNDDSGVGGSYKEYFTYKTKDGRRINKKIYIINGKPKVRDGKNKKNEFNYISLSTYKKKYS
jgi:hypothetical protein